MALSIRSAPGRCLGAALLVVLALAYLFATAREVRGDETKKKPNGAAPAGGTKTKSYSFTGLDIDGKLKTPQLLYFLNRMRSEFDTTTPDKRSFLPELKRSTDEM